MSDILQEIIQVQQQAVSSLVARLRKLEIQEPATRIYIQATDPGAIGAGSIWVDTTTNTIYYRDDTDASWLPIATAAAAVHSLTGASHTVAGLTPGDVLTALTAVTFGFAAPTTVATDPIWDAAGDLVVGTGANTAAKLPIGGAGNVLTVVAGLPSWQPLPSFVPTSRTVTAGNGLTGGGALSGDITLDVSVSGLGLNVDANNVILTSSSNPGANDAILATDINGLLQLQGLGINTAPIDITLSMGDGSYLWWKSGANTIGSLITSNGVINTLTLDVASVATKASLMKLTALAPATYLAEIQLFPSTLFTGPKVRVLYKSDDATQQGVRIVGGGLGLGDNATGPEGTFYVPSLGIIGLGAAKGQLLFTDAATDHIDILNAHLGFGSSDIEAWSYFTSVIESPTAAVAFAPTHGTVIANAYYDGAWKRKSAAAAGRISALNGVVELVTAASGAADSAITWLTGLSVNISGNVTIPGSLNLGTAAGTTVGKLSSLLTNAAGALEVARLGIATGGVVGSQDLVIGSYGTQYGAGIRAIYDFTASTNVQLALMYGVGATLTEGVRLDANGYFKTLSRFGCNNATPRAPHVVGAQITDTADATYSANEQTMLDNLKARINATMTALINNGIAVAA